MERYDNIVKIQEIRHLIANRDYRHAMLIVDTIDINQIKATTDLSTIAEVLSKNQRYDQAIKVLNIIYNKGRTRRVVYQLLQEAIRSKNLPLAKGYYREYIELAPKDPTRYIFQYLIAKLGNRPIEEQIIPLKELKKYDYIEEWTYELATLYHKASMEEECIDECNEIIVWFGEGDYVKRAKLLKGYYEGEVDLFSILNYSDYSEDEETEDKFGEAGQDIEENMEDAIEEFFSKTDIEYKSMFGDFLHNNNIKQQIIDTLIKLDAKNLTHFNIIITKDNNYDSCDSTAFSKAMVKMLYKLKYISSNKVGIIDGEIVNSINLTSQKKSLKSCSLIINKASKLKDYSIESIEKLILDKKQNIVIVLQGKEKEMLGVIEKHPTLQQYFPICIRLY